MIRNQLIKESSDNNISTIGFGALYGIIFLIIPNLKKAEAGISIYQKIWLISSLLVTHGQALLQNTNGHL